MVESLLHPDPSQPASSLSLPWWCIYYRHYIYNIYNIYPHLDMTMFTSRITKLSRNHRMQNI